MIKHQEIFEELVEKYRLQCKKEEEDEEQSDKERLENNKFYESISPTLSEIQKEEEYFVINQLKSNLTKLNIWAMDILVDFVREGSSPWRQHGATLEVLLKLCFKVLEDFEEVENDDPFHFIKQVYEIIWHSGLKDYQEDLYPLFFDLTCELLSEKYHKHKNENNKDRYCNSIIYWILMSRYSFTKNKDDFNIIFNRLKNNPYNYPNDHLFRNWQEHYEEINQSK